MTNSSSKDVHWKEYVSGWGAATTNILLTYPIMKLSWRQIIENTNAKEALKRVVDEGIYLLYRGVMPPLIQKSVNMSLMFGVYSQTFAFYIDHSLTPFQANILGGLTSGTFQSVIMPFERIQTLLVDKKYYNVYKNTFHAFSEVYSLYGVREFYRGMLVTTIRNMGVHSSFFVCKYHIDKTVMRIDMPVVRSVAQFVEGGVLSGTAAVIFHPFVSMKITIQKEVGGAFKSVIQVARELYKKNKFKTFYRGVYMQCARAFLTGGVVNTSYELYMGILTRMFG